MNEPVRKSVAGTLAAAATTVILYVVQQFGLEMPLEVAASIVLLVGGLVAYLKNETGSRPTYPQDPTRVGTPSNDPSREQIPRRTRDPEEHASQDFNGPDKPEIRE